MKVLLVNYRYDKSYIPLDLGYVKAKLDNYSEISSEIICFDKSEQPESLSVKLCVKKPDSVIFFLDNNTYSNIFTLGFSLKTCECIASISIDIKIFLHTHKIGFENAAEIITSHKYLKGIFIGDSIQSITEYLLAGEIKSMVAMNDGQIAINCEKKHECLSKTPSPILTGVLDRYIAEANQSHILTSKGCLFNCYYCFRGQRYENVTYVDIDRVIEEVKYSLKLTNVIYFIDDSFISNTGHFLEIFKELSVLDNARFKFFVRPEFLTKAIVDLLVKLNIIRIHIGVQSTKAETLKLLNRRFNPNDLRCAISQLKEAGAYVVVDLIWGLKNETFFDFKNSFLELMSLEPSNIEINALFYHQFLIDANNDRALKLVNYDPDYVLPAVDTNSLLTIDKKHEVSRFLNDFKYSQIGVRIPSTLLLGQLSGI